MALIRPTGALSNYNNGEVELSIGGATAIGTLVGVAVGAVAGADGEVMPGAVALGTALAGAAVPGGLFAIGLATTRNSSLGPCACGITACLSSCALGFGAVGASGGVNMIERRPAPTKLAPPEEWPSATAPPKQLDPDDVDDEQE